MTDTKLHIWTIGHSTRPLEEFLALLQALHIMDAQKAVEHPYTSSARIVDGRLQCGPQGRVAIRWKAIQASLQ